MKVGDYVVHNTFPPVEGEVVGCQVLNTVPESYKVCVRQANDTLYWDMLPTWNVVNSSGDGEEFSQNSVGKFC